MQSALQDYYRSFATLPNSVSMPELQLRGKDQNKLVQMVSKATSPIKHHVNEVIGKQASHSPVKEPIKSPRFTHVKPRSFKELNSRLKKSTNLCRQHERKIRSLQEEVSRLKQQLHNECQDGAKVCVFVGVLYGMDHLNCIFVIHFRKLLYKVTDY